MNDGDDRQLRVFPVYSAHLFGPQQFHRSLEAKILDHGRLRLDILKDTVTKIVAYASPAVGEALRDMRYDDEWLDNSDPEVSVTDCWYMIALAEMLSPTVSLNPLQTGAQQVLAYALPRAGWTVPEIELLFYGKALHTLVESSGNESFVREFHGIDQHGA